MKFGPLGLAGVVVCLIHAGPAGAATVGAGETAVLLGLDLKQCPDVPSDQVQGIIGIELRRPVILLGDGISSSTRTSATTAVRVVCQGLRAAIDVQDPLTGKTVGRVVDLGAAAPVARPHLLALSIVELLAASWMELRSNPNPTNPPVGIAATPETREAALELVNRSPGPRRLLRLLAATAIQTSTSGLQSWGGGMIVGGDPVPYLGWLLDLTFQHGQQAFTLGRVTADTASALGAVLAGPSRDRFALRAGLGIRAGGAWIIGTPSDAPTVGRTVRGGWWGPVAIVDGSLIVHRRIVIEIIVELGRVVLPVAGTVQGGSSVAIDGNWIRGGLGVGFTL